MSIIPTPSSSRPWWSRSSVLSKSSSDSKQLPCSQGSKLSASKKFSTIATAIGLKPKKTAAPVQEPASPILPLHTGDIDAPPRPTVVKPVSVAVGWSDPRALQAEDFLDAYPQSVFSTDLDPFATAAKYPDGPPNIPDSLRYSTFSEVSVLDPHGRQDAPHTHNRMSFASSSSLSHHRSDVTSDSSPFSSPLLSPVMSGRHLSRLTVESERMREHFPPSPVSPQSLRGGWDDRSRIAPSPSSATLTDAHGKGITVARPRTRSRGIIATGRSGNDPLLSDQMVSSTSSINATGSLVVIRQPSSSRLQPLQPPTAPPASELPPAPGDDHQPDFSLLPAFVEPTPQSATSSSSSLSFASSDSSKLDALEVEGHRRRLKDAKKSGKSRPTSPSKYATRDVHDLTSKPSHSSREFSPTRTLRKAISIQSIPKRTPGNGKPPSLSPVEDTKSVKKQRSFHHTRIPRPPFPASLKQTASSNASGRGALSVPEEPKVGVQLPQKSPLSSPVLSPTNVRKRLFSGTSLRCSMSSQAPDPDDDTPSIFSLPSVASTLPTPHTIPTGRSSISNKRQLSSFWDDERPVSPDTGNESRDIGPRHILSAADILRFEKNMVLDGENHNGLVRSRENSITSPATPNHPVRTTHEVAASVRSFSPPSVTRQFYTLGAASSKSLASSRQRTRGNSLRGKVSDVTNGRPQIGVTSLEQAIRSLSSQSLSALHGLPQPPRQRTRPATSSGAISPMAEDAPLFTPGDRTSIIALMPLSPPPARRSATRRALDPPSAAPTLRPMVSRRPSFLDMRDDLDRELLPPDDSFLDMGKVSLDTVRSSLEEDLALS